MYTLDIAQLISSALKENGCEQIISRELDSYSTIVIDLLDLPSIYVSTEDNVDVWLWSRIGEYSENLLTQRGAGLLRELILESPFSRTGQLQLVIQDDYFVLKALLHPDYLKDSQIFSEALDGFFNRLELFCGSLL